jgi:preprotein translocase subunit SecA
MDSMLTKLGLKDGEAIVHPWINKALERAQKKVEARNFDIRKNLLKYDDVLNDQRKVIFEQRVEMMEAPNISETVSDMRREVVDDLVTTHIPERAYAEQWDAAGLKTQVTNILNLDLPVEDWVKEEGIGEDDIRERLTEATNAAFNEKVERFGPDIMHYVERQVVMQTLDHLWREHIVNLDHLRSVIGFRGYAQRDPLQEYKSEAFELFQSLLNNLRQAVTAQLMRVELVQQAPPQPEPPLMQAHHLDPTTGEDEFANTTYQAEEVIVAPENRNPDDPQTWGKVGRNEACPCGSGKKYKHCHGAFEQV